jgi:hypothetical protein
MPTFNLITPPGDDTFVRADTSPGAAQSTTGVGNGWIDKFGGKYSISSNRLKNFLYVGDFYSKARVFGVSSFRP